MTALRTTFTTIIADGKKAGELPAGLNDEEFIDALIGPLFFRRLIRKLLTDRTWIGAISSTPSPPLTPAPGPHQPRLSSGAGIDARPG
jgi:hypothetical protein